MKEVPSLIWCTHYPSESQTARQMLTRFPFFCYFPEARSISLTAKLKFLSLYRVLGKAAVSVSLYL
jgi:hypothetical protein